jgi:hypothetical protein
MNNGYVNNFENRFSESKNDKFERMMAEAQASQKELEEKVGISIDQIYSLIPRAVLLVVKSGEKRPKTKDWQKVTFADTQDGDYQESLRRHLNTGVLLGRASGGLCTIDVDSDEFFRNLIQANLETSPEIASLVTRCKRGAQFWLYIQGDYPFGVKKIKTLDGRSWGEWRSDGGQSIIRGVHPDHTPEGQRIFYRWLEGQPPPRLRFTDIVWPEGLVLPWIEERKAKPEESETKTLSSQSGRIVREKRVPVQVPGDGRITSDFARALGKHLATADFFIRGGICVQQRYDRATDTHEVKPVDPYCFQTALEAICIPFRLLAEGNKDKNGAPNLVKVPGSISDKLARTVLASPYFLEQLLPVSAFNSIRLPVIRDNGVVEMLPEGYDHQSGILTVTKKGTESLDPRFTLSQSVEYFRGILDEFCFHADDRERAIAVTLAGALTLFCRHMLPDTISRPGFLFTANSPGAGKTLLAKLAMVGPAELPGARTAPSENDEMEKIILAKVLGGRSVIFFDNLKGNLSSPALESLITSPYYEGRTLGHSKETRMIHGITVFVTGNGLSVSQDLGRRFLHVDLFLTEANSEDRKIRRTLDDFTLLEERPKILQALWAIVNAWNNAGKPRAKTVHNSFAAWSTLIGGILENAGFASAFGKFQGQESGDQTTDNIEHLIDLMQLDQRYKLGEIINLCAEYGLFSWWIPEEGEMEKGDKLSFSKLIRSYVGRHFKSGRKLSSDGDTRDRFRFVATDLRSNLSVNSSETQNTNPLFLLSQQVHHLHSKKSSY